jgi:small subunit ribosomal protein S13
VGLGQPFYLNKINGYNFGIVSMILKLLIISDVRIKRRVEFDIAKLIGINSIKGLRHKLSLPVHGQRTRTNASTQRLKRQRRFVFTKMGGDTIKKKIKIYA